MRSRSARIPASTVPANRTGPAAGGTTATEAGGSAANAAGTASSHGPARQCSAASRAAAAHAPAVTIPRP